MNPDFINPPEWPKPRGYNNGVVLSGARVLCVAGQVAWDERGRIVGRDDFAAQFTQCLRNIRRIVECAGGSVQHVGRLTIFVLDKRRYLASLADIGTGYRDVFGKHFPAMTLVEVKDLLEEGALLEIEALAMLP